METRVDRRTVNYEAEFAVRLTVTAGSAFAWEVTECPAGLEQLGSGVEPVAASARAGAPRTQIFRFFALTRGTHILAFALRRPADAAATEERRVRVTVT